MHHRHIHCDLHDEYILIHEKEVYISNLGLSQPTKSFTGKHNIYTGSPVSDIYIVFL